MVCFGDDLSCQCDEADQKSLLLSSDLLSCDFVGLSLASGGSGGFLPESLLSEYLVNHLVEESFRVVDSARIVRSGCCFLVD